MERIIEAPFTPVQVAALNQWQEAGFVHPFTCGNRGDSPHPFANGDFGVLRATENGWVCDWCDYTQNWAHAFMAEPLVNPFDLFNGE